MRKLPKNYSRNKNPYAIQYLKIMRYYAELFEYALKNQENYIENE